MNTKIINIKKVKLENIIIPEHSCMPDISDIHHDTWLFVDHNNLRAICSIWTENVPCFKNLKTAVVGNFYAHDEEAGRSLLGHMTEKFNKEGFEYMVGPIDGDTWHNYRLVTDSGNYPPFFMEYYTPKSWPNIFLSAGFEKIASYSSAQAVDIEYKDDSALRFEKRKPQLGITDRPFDITQAKDDLAAVHALSMQSFTRSFLYTHISFSDFMKLNEKILNHIDPDFFRLVECQDKLVGFIFAIPDYLQKEHDGKVDTLIIKTVAKVPDRRYAGLGNYLVHKIHQKAAQKGFSSVIHALMHDNNTSRSISDKSAKTIRQYALYGKRLGL